MILIDFWTLKNRKTLPYHQNPTHITRSRVRNVRKALDARAMELEEVVVLFSINASRKLVNITGTCREILLFDKKDTAQAM